jgi:hypothetical protein
MTPGAPAIGNAIYNATGVRIKDLPMAQEVIAKALKKMKPGVSSKTGQTTPQG